MHLPAVFRFPEAVVFWLVYGWVFIPEMTLIRKSAGPAPAPQDEGTMHLIVVANQTAMLVGFASSFSPWLVMPWPRAWLSVGTVLLFLGGLLRRACFRALGQYFTGAVVVRPDQAVVEEGPYRWVRHPSYSAGLLIFMGMGVAFGNWLGLLVLTLVPALVYTRRVRVEERALLATIGEPYQAYMGRTRRFIPFVV